MKKPTLASTLMRLTCPLVVFGYLCWLAFASANWKLLLGLIALVGTLGIGALIIRRVSRVCEAIPDAEPRHRAALAAALLMTRRLGAVFCIMAVGVSVCFILESTAHYMGIAIALILSGWAAMLWIARRALAPFV
ncbi:MAG: hypothetical protein RSD41_05060 [Kiritimatiellia bacterium]